MLAPALFAGCWHKLKNFWQFLLKQVEMVLKYKLKTLNFKQILLKQVEIQVVLAAAHPQIDVFLQFL